MQPAIIGFAEKKNTRQLEPGADVYTYLRDVIAAALRDAGLMPADVDGLGVFSFYMGPDKAVDLAFRLGLKLNWVVEATHGGASAINTLGHALRALDAGAAKVIVVVAGDVRGFGPSRAPGMASYSRSRRDYLVPLGYGGPNSLFAMLTQRQMQAHGLTREDYGRVVIAQRAWAAGSANATYRSPLTMEEYLAAEPVADPLTRFDCPPACSGASALVLAAADRCPRGRAPIHIRAIRECYNYDNHEGDGLRTGLSTIAADLWNAAGVGPGDMHLANLYDDYPAMILAQLNDLKIIPDGDLKGFIRDKIATREFPVNTSGGLLSGGQAGGAGAQLGTVEMVRQLQHRAGDNQVTSARFGVSTGYGQVIYRYGAAAAAAVFERGVMRI
jgi:acetyl-CoA acetyltransferase